MESKSTSPTITSSEKKLCDSGYSNSCSNSNSQRSASSKSRRSGSNSSGSSGYCGASKADVRTTSEMGLQPPKSNKDKEHKCKKHKSETALPSTSKCTAIIEENKTPNVVLHKNIDEEMMCVDSLPDDLLENIAPDIGFEDDGGLSAVNVIETAETQPRLDKTQHSWIEPTLPLDKFDKDLPNISGDNFDSKPPSYQPEDGFYCVISMCDGVVLYATPSLTTALGFPKDMWLGRSFIDFMHPKDRETFSSQIAADIAFPILYSQTKCKDVKHCVYALLRKYKGLKTSGFGVVDKPVSYQAFKLTITIRYQNDTSDLTQQLDNINGMFLVIVANPVYSAHLSKNEEFKTEKFGMRHTATCILSHVDPDVVANLGFLPQDMLGKSIFDFYHPEDMSFLKETYESIITICQIAGSVFRSKPYRFAVQNGGFVMIETEWSSFVNPWSKRLEFVIGLHRVIKGPKNPDVFADYNNEEIEQISEEALHESKILQGKIMLLLNKELSVPIANTRKEVTKRCKDMANIMENLVDDINKTDLHLDIDPTISVSWEGMERDSVMLGEISPHHDYSDSKSSSETPPSYNQLNYNENIERFFQSKPITTVSDESSDRTNAMQMNIDTDQEGKVSSVRECLNIHQKCHSPLENSGDWGSGSGGNLSSMSNPNMESLTTTNGSNNDSYKTQLTKEVLYKHNADMEKIMMLRHKEQRSHSKHKEGRKKHKTDKKKFDNMEVDKRELPTQNYGVKRSVSLSWDEDTRKVLKSRNKSKKGEKSKKGSNDKTCGQHCSNTSNNQRLNDINLWPPFSVSVTHNMDTTPTLTVNNSSNLGGFATGMFPFYYIPAQHQRPSDEKHAETNQQSPYQVQYMSGMMYNTMFPTSPMFPVPVLPVPVAPVMTSVNTDCRQMHLPMSMPESAPTPGEQQAKFTLLPSKFQRPASQATSVKAEPGSALGSIASASVANKAMSECSRKDFAFPSVCSPGSPLVSPSDGKAHMNKEQNNRAEPTPNKGSTTIDDDSLFSSSYSSFLRTDGSGSNDDSKRSESDEESEEMMPLQFNQGPAAKSRQRLRKKDPPWLEAVSATPEIIYRYQMSIRGLEDILESDLRTLRSINQPMLVNDQLNQLYIEMELEGLSGKLTLEEELTTSSSSSGEENVVNVAKTKKRKPQSSFMMFCDENDPLPSPDN